VRSPKKTEADVRIAIEEGNLDELEQKREPVQEAAIKKLKSWARKKHSAVSQNRSLKQYI
jgi:hypothetical protein